MIAEFYGKRTGTNGGLAGSQELSNTDINFYSGTILSGALSMAVGDAFAWESMTGWEKFGGNTFGESGDIKGLATHMLVWDYDLSLLAKLISVSRQILRIL